MSTATARYVALWPGGRVDRFEVDRCGRVVYGREHIWEVWESAKAKLHAAGAETRRLEEGELWPPECMER